MRKKCSREKDVRNTKQKRCSICINLTLQINLEHISLSSMRKKYYFPQVQTYHFRNSNNLIYDPYSIESIQFVEMNKLTENREILTTYLTFQEIVKNIKSVIHKRVQKDFYGWVDFHKEHFDITNIYYVKRKHLIQNNQKMQKYLKSTVTMHSTGEVQDKNVREYFENKIKNQLDHQRFAKITQNDTNSSTIEIRRLTKNLEIMIEQLGQMSVLKGKREGFTKARIIGLKQKAKHNGETLFKRNIEKEISVIGKNQEDKTSPVDFQDSQHYPETYGLENLKSKNGPKGKKAKLSLKSIQKITNEEKAPPQTPKPRFFHGVHEYEEIQQERNTIYKKSSREKKFTPLSPGNNKSASLKKKSLSKHEVSTSRNKGK